MASVNGPHWRQDRKEWCLQWRWNGNKEHLEVSVTALDGDKDAAQRVAERVKEHVGSTGGERTDFITFVDQCIAEKVKTQSLSEKTSSAGGGSKATVQLRSQPSDDSHPAVGHYRGSNSPDGTADHDRFRDGGLPTRPPKRDDRCGKKKKREADKIMLLQLQRPYFETIKSERKRWEGRPLVERRNNGSFAPWRYRHLATEGRVIKFQCGPPPLLEMQIAEVRLFMPNECSSIPPERAMVMELGADLLPDLTDVDARVQVYRELYGADICAHGFVAMRLQRKDEIKAAGECSAKVLEEPRGNVIASKSTVALPGSGAPTAHPVAAKVVTTESQPGVRRTRTCASPRRCGNIGCDDCYPPGGASQKQHKGAHRGYHRDRFGYSWAALKSHLKPKRALPPSKSFEAEAEAIKRLCANKAKIYAPKRGAP